ncbi:MAG: hypothetical protein HY905_20370 [Deltaproteobacteria bacterium]|nr:hypothetical protein [Deltaproteobacteria bacterium]
MCETRAGVQISRGEDVGDAAGEEDRPMAREQRHYSAWIAAWVLVSLCCSVEGPASGPDAAGDTAGDTPGDAADGTDDDAEGCDDAACSASCMYSEHLGMCVNGSCDCCCPWGTNDCYEPGDCRGDMVCDLYDCGTTSGTCIAVPATCPATWSPVCGCDSTTYANDCERQRAGEPPRGMGVCRNWGACRFDDPAGEPGLVCDVRSCASEDGTWVRLQAECPSFWAPVCGCNGTTYANDCERMVAGAAGRDAGPCGSRAACGAAGDPPCPADEDCDRRGCEEGSAGSCVVLPATCPDDGPTVCGCDGTTYVSDCERIRAGVARRSVGQCPTVDTCDADGNCADRTWCNRSVCDDLAGFCIGPADFCPDEWDPVCTCSGRTFVNACEVWPANYWRSQGYCSSGVPCSGPSGRSDECGMYEVCDVQGCASTEGMCVRMPEARFVEWFPLGPCPGIWDPVCGCDGVTYFNDCERIARRAALASREPCPADSGGAP